MPDDIRTGSFDVKDAANLRRTVLIFQSRTPELVGSGRTGYRLGPPRHLLDGRVVERVEKGLYRLADTGEYLTSNDPVAP